MGGETAQQIAARVVTDVGGAFATGLAYIGDRLGLFRAVASEDTVSSGELAAMLGLDERYVREWLKAMVSAGYVDAEKDRYFMTPSQKAVLVDEASPVFAAGAFQFALPSLELTRRLVECFRHGGGVAYRELGGEISEAIDRMHRPWFDHLLTAVWLPAVPGLGDRLDSGIRVLDVGCGLGRSTVAMARAWPRSTVVGLDPDPESMRTARNRGRDAGVRVEFTEARLDGVPGDGVFDLIVAVDCIHDMADPVRELGEMRRLLAPEGVVSWSEPTGSRNPMANRAPVEKMRATLSPYHCLTVSMAENGRALGTIIGEDGARELASEAGFEGFTRLELDSAVQQFFLLRH